MIQSALYNNGSGQPRACARALQRFRSNRHPEAHGGRAQAHAHSGPAPRAATSGALVKVRFRVAALLAGRPWGLVTRAGAHERPRRRGSAGCPESGRTESFDLQAVLNLVDKPDTPVPQAFGPHFGGNAAGLDNWTFLGIVSGFPVAGLTIVVASQALAISAG